MGLEGRALANCPIGCAGQPLGPRYSLRTAGLADSYTSVTHGGGFVRNMPRRGGMAEWSMAVVLKLRKIGYLKTVIFRGHLARGNRRISATFCLIL